MKSRRFIVLTSILISLIEGYCYAQLQAPEQVDTLYIESMQYHFDEIRPENWPFSYVIRKADAFVFANKEFKIIDSSGNYHRKSFTLTDGEDESHLDIVSQEGNLLIKFSDYELVCNTRKENLTPATKNEPILDTKATLTVSHNAVENCDTFKAVRTEAKPNALLKGRSVDGALPRPAYNVQESGTVVVTIWVDNYGKVRKAVAGADGTTTTDKKLWAAARKAAMETRFTMDSDAPALQQGSISYIFRVI